MLKWQAGSIINEEVRLCSDGRRVFGLTHSLGWDRVRASSLLGLGGVEMRLRCFGNRHAGVKQRSDHCLECGHHLLKTDAEYDAELNAEIGRLIDNRDDWSIERKERLIRQLLG